MMNKKIVGVCMATLAFGALSLSVSQAQSTMPAHQGQPPAANTSTMPPGTKIYVNGKLLSPTEAAKVYPKFKFAGGGSIGSFPTDSAVVARIDAIDQAYQKVIDQGNHALQTGQADEAIRDFEEAQSIQPDEGQSFVGLADAYTAKGDISDALAAYRGLFYHQPGRSWSSSLEGEPIQLVKFAMLLAQNGQTQEALTAYNRGAAIENTEGGSSGQAVPIPLLGSDPGQVEYTPQLLMAMAHLVMGMDASPMDVQELRNAVSLAPDSAAAHYYLGKCLYSHNQNAEAKRELQQAARLGDAQTVAATQQFLPFLH